MIELIGMIVGFFVVTIICVGLAEGLSEKFDIDNNDDDNYDDD